MTGIDLFLRKQFYCRDQHARGEDKFVYDDENIHYAILWILVDRSPAFARSFLAMSESPHSLSATLKPDGGLFDLLFVVDGSHHYCEVKVWASLSDDQFQKQSAFLASHEAKGIYVLFTKAADRWRSSLVHKESGGRSRVIGVSALVEMCSALESELPAEVRELADAYRGALLDLNGRWPSSGAIA